MDKPGMPGGGDTIPAMLYAGIDEAGYGPMFGPLAAAVSVFEVNDDAPGCLWTTLDAAVTRTRRDPHGRIAVEDSKKLKGAGTKRHPLLHLERGVLAFLAATTTSSAWFDDVDDSALLERLGVEVPRARWYDTSSRIPVGLSVGELRIDAARLKRVLDDTGCRCAHLGAQVLGARDFNRRVARARSKATVNFEQIMTLMERCWRRAGDKPLTLVVDRQSGRSDYLDLLRLTWPDARRRVIEETPACSRYHLTMPGRSVLDLQFATEADHHHLPVALASMTAKYVRELLMIRFNAFFSACKPDLKPTAGYVQDGRRFLSDIEELLEPLEVDRAALVRSC